MCTCACERARSQSHLSAAGSIAAYGKVTLTPDVILLVLLLVGLFSIMIVCDSYMSCKKKRARLLTCYVCQFRTYSKGGFVWHQRSAHGGETGNGIPGGKRARSTTLSENDAADEQDGIPLRPRARRRVDRAAGVPVRSVERSGPATGRVVEPDDTAAGDEGAAAYGALVADDAGSYDAAIRAQLYPLLEMTGVLRDAAADGSMDVEYAYQSLATRVFSLYEVLDDAARSVPILERRKKSRSGRFNTRRLRALQQFVLGAGGAGLSLREQKKLYEFLGVWDRRDMVDPMETCNDLSLSAVFPTVSSFTNALRDDIHDAVLSAGWKKLKIREGGAVYEVYYRSVLEVVMARLRNGEGGVRLWSGDVGPAPPTNQRQSPMDGDAFRLCEREVVATHGGASFVLGLHLYSDSSQLSWSGGTFFYCSPHLGETTWLSCYLRVVWLCARSLSNTRC